MGDKYELTTETIFYDQVDLHRIRALRDIKRAGGQLIAKAGQLGGFVESLGNLSKMVLAG